MNLKQQVAAFALNYIKDVPILGIGSGSTVNAFIEALADIKSHLEGCVPASEGTAAYLKKYGLPVLSFNAVGTLSHYIDGADEINRYGEALKGGGAALVREKILAQASRQWICLVEASKVVKRLGARPVPVEVIPMARSFVARELVKLGGDPVYREGVVTDNQHHILDVYHLQIEKPIMLEEAINKIPGVVDNGLFARRAADIILVADPSGCHEVIPVR